MSGGYVKGMIIGGAIGVLAGMLLLPKVGMDVKQNLMQSGKKVMRTVKKKMPEVEAVLGEN